MKKAVILLAIAIFCFSTSALAVTRENRRWNAQVGLQGGYETIYASSEAVGTPGTAIPLRSTSTGVAQCRICVSDGSVGAIGIGFSSTFTVSDDNLQGVLISKDVAYNQSGGTICQDIYVDDASDIYIDAVIGGDAVNYICYDF